MPITIALCDDDAQQLSYLQQLLHEWQLDTHADIVVQEYRNAEQFLFGYPDNAFDLLLLDIEMDGINGMELARLLRGKGDMLPIIFITGYSEYMSEGYDVEALHYLLKPVDRAKLFWVLNKYLTRCDTSRQILLPCENGTVRISEWDILCCEAFGKKTQITLKDGKELLCTCGLSAAAKKVGKGFVPCHRSYVVNIGYIRSISKTDVTLDNGRKIPLSRRQYDTVNKAFIDYYKERSK